MIVLYFFFVFKCLKDLHEEFDTLLLESTSIGAHAVHNVVIVPIDSLKRWEPEGDNLADDRVVLDLKCQCER